MSEFVEKMIILKLSFEREIAFIKDTLERKKENLKTINAFVRKYCEHEWIDDYIDIDVERGMNVTYCKHCELSK